MYKPWSPPSPQKNHTLNTEINLFINIAAFSERPNATTKLPFTVFTDLYIINCEVRSFPGKMKTWRETKRKLQQPSALLLTRTDTRRLTKGLEMLDIETDKLAHGSPGDCCASP